MMIEQLEFEISQYADGTLPAASVAALERTLESDAEAQAVLAEYRRLDGALAAAPAVPPINYDRLAEHLSAAVARQAEVEEERGAAAYRMPWVRAVRGLAIAASLLLAAGIAWRVVGRKPPMLNVIGPSHSEVAAGKPVVSVSIEGPELAQAAPVVRIDLSPADASDVGWRYAQGVVERPSRVIIASGADAVQDGAAPYFR